MNSWLSSSYLTYAIGLLAQLFFSARLLIQWFKSEKEKKIMTPEIFWEFSLIAAFLLFIYGWLRHDFAIILGQTITYFIYIRNMYFQKSWQKIHSILRIFILSFPVIILVLSIKNHQNLINQLFKNQNIPPLLIIWGSLGQVIFTLRFVYQWLYSERIKKSRLPITFWVISLIGSAMILSYAVYRKDPILFLGQSVGFIIYFRNIIIGKRELK
ncbi:MAG: hypothetical protein PWQ09_382 [Candidatus Cloacimonadota bacterium]|jgi:lipid-A-disaccharide synthase-like uncharacterized protein|nr:hypothetical protein [Candidatus Cloacimonadota bacterium]